MTSSLLVGLALVLAAPAPKETSKKDVPTVVGVWNVESAIKGGKVNDNSPGGNIQFFTDGKVILKEGGKDIMGTYTTNVKKDPAEIDLNLEGGGMNLKLPGIFKIEGDTLKMCLTFMGDRPAKLESPDGSMTVLLTLKRTKKD